MFSPAKALVPILSLLTGLVVAQSAAAQLQPTCTPFTPMGSQDLTPACMAVPTILDPMILEQLREQGGAPTQILTWVIPAIGEINEPRGEQTMRIFFGSSDEPARSSFRGSFAIREPDGSISDLITISQVDPFVTIDFTSNPLAPQDFGPFTDLGPEDPLTGFVSPLPGVQIGAFGTAYTVRVGSDGEAAFTQNPFIPGTDISDGIQVCGSSSQFVCSQTVPPQQAPEPASLALLGAGLAGIALVRRRACKQM